MPDATILLCYDGSDDAKHAIRESSALFAVRSALVLSVWQDAKAMPTLAWMAGPVPGVEELFGAARDAAQRIADEGVEVATAAGFDATALVVEAPGPVWPTVIDAAEEHDVAAIVMGSRGLSGVRSVLLGSVSNGVVHHASRPTLVVRRADA